MAKLLSTFVLQKHIYTRPNRAQHSHVAPEEAHVGRNIVRAFRSLNAD